MSKRQWLLGLALVDLAALNTYALYHYGLGGFVELITANAVVVAVLVDLAIALGLVAVWMWNDARDRGISPLPYLVTTLALGSIGPLLYLIRTHARDADTEDAPVPIRGVMTR